MRVKKKNVRNNDFGRSVVEQELPPLTTFKCELNFEMTEFRFGGKATISYEERKRKEEREKKKQQRELLQQQA